MKATRILTYVAGGLVLLVVAAVAAALAIVDGAFVKERAQKVMKERYQRTLSIEGTPKVSVFPVAGIELGKVRLTERASDKEFLSLESAKVGVRVMPLLSKTIEVEALSLAGLKVNVVRAKNGAMNFDDLAGKDADKAGDSRPVEPRARPRVRIAEVHVERVHVAYKDEATGRTVTLTDLNLKTGRLADAEPSPVAFSMQVKGANPGVDVKAGLSGKLSMDLPNEMFEVAGLAFEAKGTIDRDTLNVALAAPQVKVTPSKAAGSGVSASFALKGPQRSVDVKLKMAALEGTGSALSIASIALDMDIAAEGNAVKGRIETPLNASLAERTWALPKIVANLTFSGPAIPQKSVTLPIQASAKADLAKQAASAEVATRFDDSMIQAEAGATKFAPLHATFDLNIDRLNLDRYIAQKPAGESKPDARIDLSALKGPQVAGKVQFGSLKANGATLSNLKAEIKLTGGKLEVAPYSAELYGGKLEGRLEVDANTNRIEAKDTVTGVALGPLLRDVAKKDMLEGKGTVRIDVNTTGSSVAAMKKALAGSAKVEVKDGAIKGINLAESVRNFKSSMGAKSSSAGDSAKQTDFTEMSASFAIRNGVAHNDDLKAASPFLRLGGSGDIDIGNSTLDYNAKASLVATGKGQGGAADAAGITIPVKLGGTFDKPTWSIDFTGMLGGLGGAVGGAAGKVTETVKSGAGAVGSKLKGLFGK